jgi:hypothetical protein
VHSVLVPELFCSEAFSPAVADAAWLLLEYICRFAAARAPSGNWMDKAVQSLGNANFPSFPSFVYLSLLLMITLYSGKFWKNKLEPRAVLIYHSEPAVYVNTNKVF